VINYLMETHRDEMRLKYQSFLDKYLISGEELQVDNYKMPMAAAEDTAYRYALRLVKVAEVAATVSGYSVAYNTLKYIYYGSEIVNRVIAGDLLTVVGPVSEALDVFGIRGPTGVLNVYYLGCQHVLDYQMDPSVESNDHEKGVDGVVSISCPTLLIDHLGSYLAAMQWLYAATLPAPHDDNDWSSWYLSRLVAEDGWTVLACVNETSRLPNGRKCPAFALLVRRRQVHPSSSHSAESHGSGEGDNPRLQVYLDDCATALKEERQAVLVIRGTTSTMDWSINLDEACDPFVYYALHPSSTSSLIDYSESVAAAAAPTDDDRYQEARTLGLHAIEGHVHRGMHQAAVGILDSFTMRTYLAILSTNGYAINVAGHSLGSGVAALLAATLQNGYRLSSDPDLRKAKVRSVCFASPPCASAELSDAIAADGLVINCIKWGDLIPRFSRRNVTQLAKDVTSFAATETASQWRSEDLQCAKKYASSIGKAANMAPDPVLEVETVSVSESSDRKANESMTEVPAVATAAAAAVTVDNHETSEPSSSASTSAAALQQQASATAMKLMNAASTWRSSLSSSTLSSTSIFGATKNDAAPAAATPTSASAKTATVVTVTATSAASANASSSTLTAMAVAVPQAPPATAPATSASASASASSYLSLASSMLSSLAASTQAPATATAVDAKAADTIKAESIIAAPLVAPLVPLEVAGLMVQLYRTNNASTGSYEAAIIDYHHPSLQRLRLLIDRVLDDHRAIGYNAAMRSLKHLRRAQSSTAAPSEITMVISRKRKPYQSIAMADSEASEAAVPNTSASTAISNWRRCHVCQLDVHWPFIFRSSANRALVAQHCTRCGSMCCIFCAPAGDTIPGDGVNTNITLEDYRVNYPVQGRLLPERVCLPCYLRSYLDC
jgi:hypothetical protein